MLVMLEFCVKGEVTAEKLELAAFAAPHLGAGAGRAVSLPLGKIGSRLPGLYCLPWCSDNVGVSQRFQKECGNSQDKHLFHLKIWWGGGGSSG